MFIKTGKIGSFTYMITGNNECDVIVEITSKTKVIDSTDNVTLNEAMKFVEAYNKVIVNE